MVKGVRVIHGALDPAAQASLVEEVRAVVLAAPLFAPVTPGGRQMTVRMTSAGRLGWVTDTKGYRYEARHPSGVAWPPVPPIALDLWRRHSGVGRDPDCCLVNFYGEGARMGLHQDRDEADFRWPVLSISLGDDALFRIGGTRAQRSDGVGLAAVGGRRCPWRRGAARLPRYRPGASWQLYPPSGWGPDQPDPARC